MLGVSCTTPIPRLPADQLHQLWQTREQALLLVQHWELRGRLAVRSEERGGTASLSWKRSSAQHDIRLNGPLGRGVVRIHQDETGARLQDSEQRVLHAASAEELLYRYTGWQLPLTNLNFWVLGVPVPDVPSQQQLDDAGRLKSLRQQGWDIQYQDYVLSGKHELPSRFSVTLVPDGTATDLPAMEVRFVIERWAQVQ